MSWQDVMSHYVERDDEPDLPPVVAVTDPCPGCAVPVQRGEYADPKHGDGPTDERDYFCSEQCWEKFSRERIDAVSAAAAIQNARDEALERAAKQADRITPERLLALGFMTDDEKAAGEFCVRIRGGDDDGWKRDSDADKPEDEIAELCLSPVPNSETGAWGAFLETYRSTDLNVVASIELGIRETMAEVIALCRGLKAWAIRYPETTSI